MHEIFLTCIIYLCIQEINIWADNHALYDICYHIQEIRNKDKEIGLWIEEATKYRTAMKTQADQMKG